MIGNSALAWHTMDEAIRLAKQMRLHDENSYDGLDPIEAKLCRNAFWFLFSAEKLRYEVTALARPESIDKPEYIKYAENGVIITPVELKSSDLLVQALVGMDVVISCMSLQQLDQEMALIEAAHAAGVGRYVPSWFGPCCPPRGVMLLRDTKEDILDYIKRLYLLYTAIDVGWWY
ncbi:hypothetical protein CEP53_002714 [Fusarium sp. AF-6]|nr:hypothetical protein CEP53_002714 [Fusarium sp. AF-6]